MKEGTGGRRGQGWRAQGRSALTTRKVSCSKARAKGRGEDDSEIEGVKPSLQTYLNGYCFLHKDYNCMNSFAFLAVSQEKSTKPVYTIKANFLSLKL